MLKHVAPQAQTPGRAPLLIRELRFAWLLREDVRMGAPIEDAEAQKDFQAWWLLHAPCDFPAAAARVRPEDLPHVRDVVRPAPPGEDFEFTRLMEVTWRQRTDARAQHPPDTPAGTAGFIRWFFVHGVPEHNLFKYLPAMQVRRLSAGAWADAATGQTAGQTAEEDPYSLLQLYSWQMDPALQTEFPLHTPAGRARFLGWYYCEGVRALKHEGYLELDPPAWLAEEHPSFPGLSRLGALAWLWACPECTPEHLADPRLREHAARWFHEEAVERYRLGTLLAPAPAPLAAPEPESRRVRSGPLPPGVNIVGFAKGELGIGEDSRMAAASLESAGVPFAVVNVRTGPNTRQQDCALDAHLREEAPYGVNLFCLTGLDTARVWLEKGADLFAGRLNIGYWPWELPEWPAVWSEAYELVDEIWVSSRYTQQAFQKSSPVPVLLMPMAVTVDRLRPLPRGAFGLPDDAFLFLYVFDFNSYLARKNPWAALRAFRKAFPSGIEPVRLVLKVMNTSPDDPRWQAFSAEASRDPRILHIGGTLDRGDVLGLFAACDAYVSPHRSEGFGRTLAEAMLLGKPVAATGYSGNEDFLTAETGYPVGGRLVPVGRGEYPFGEGLYWAEPDIDQLAASMRDMVENPARAAALAEKGRGLIEARHNPAAVGAAYRARLEQLLARR
ncbi:glycosyltransferase family 4 protein [Fundidesulfovibrio agrisoli]|uniref:glycosyltransferase family 4 protein n=1 Tax=Fundidesulfovibrio agrisoli TaxID=2922717 RepID=UPI001FAC3860|nr:glycosyltransferase family 4 protein [Fundidesulfovibrio agrisoli]